jgi:hypothetical protein
MITKGKKTRISKPPDFDLPQYSIVPAFHSSVPLPGNGKPLAISYDAVEFTKVSGKFDRLDDHR